MNYLKEYNDLFKDVIAQEKELAKRTSDYTYLAFEDFVQNGLRSEIENALKKGWMIYSFNFLINHLYTNYYDNKEVGSISVFGKTYYKINIDEFCQYLKQIPHINIELHYDVKESYFRYKLIDLINYYYEELQREDYQTNKTR